MKNKIFFENYDYSDDSSGPGIGLFHGPMGKYKSVDEFRKSKSKRNKKLKKLYKKYND